MERPDRLAQAAVVLAIIPARGGSKGLARKNVLPLGGHPLIAWSIAAAQSARTVDRVVVSTEDPEIAEVARAYGAEVPFRRPIELAADDTPDLPVFQHALRWLASNQSCRPELVVHLRPTTPLRRVDDIDRAVELLRARNDVDSVRSVVAPFQNPFKMWRRNPEGLLEPLVPTAQGESPNMPRQKLPPVSWHNGYVDVIRARILLEQQSMCGARVLPLDGEEREWADIDSQDVLDFAEYLLTRGRIRPAVPHRRC